MTNDEQLREIYERLACHNCEQIHTSFKTITFYITIILFLRLANMMIAVSTVWIVYPP